MEIQSLFTNDHKYKSLHERIRTLDTYHLQIMDSDLSLPWLDDAVESVYLQSILAAVQTMLCCDDLA